MADIDVQAILDELRDPTQDPSLSGVGKLMKAAKKTTSLISRQGLIDAINEAEAEIGGEIEPYNTAREAVANLVGSTRVEGAKVGRIVDALFGAVEPARDITRPASERLADYLAGERGITKEAAIDLILDLAAEIGELDALREALTIVATDNYDYYGAEGAKVIAEHLSEKVAEAKSALSGTQN